VARVLGCAAPAKLEFSGVATDTRTLEPGALFVALTGERFDGHDYLAAARESGAAGAVVRRGSAIPQEFPVFEVDDTLQALGLLARDRRREVQGPVVAVTGTNGKTATKEMLALALATRWSVHATSGNLNNLIGVPLTILAADPSTEALVVEAGASVPGEIARLRDVIEPSLAVVTNVAAGHVEGFGSLEGVLREKTALLQGAAAAVVGTRPPQLAELAREVAERVVTAGVEPAADVRPDEWRLDGRGRPVVSFRGVEVSIPAVGRHQVENTMLALAAAEQLGLELTAVAAALAELSLPGGRCELLEHGSLLVLNDCYNSNPASLAAALETAEALRGERPLAVALGTMLELGAESDALHREMAERVIAAKPSLLGAVGAFAAALEPHRAVLGDRLLTAADPASLGELLAERLVGDELVLLKASRGVRMERAIRHLIPDRE
jgi:UDP-N-acetylmuramoyl-tripeptide--D-alanyl-D-alanine ligase